MSNQHRSVFTHLADGGKPEDFLFRHISRGPYKTLTAHYINKLITKPERYYTKRRPQHLNISGTDESLAAIVADVLCDTPAYAGDYQELSARIINALADAE